MSRSHLTVVGSRRLVIKECLDAQKTLEQALQSVPKGQRAKYIRQLDLLKERLANGERLSNENFPKEAVIPTSSNSQYFYAFKKIPIRAYCWFSKIRPRTVFISHYSYKDQKKLRQADIDIVGNNFYRIEVLNHEC